jgi:hypothetical protein
MDPLLTKSTKKHVFVERLWRALNALIRASWGRTCTRGVQGCLVWVRWPAWQNWLAGFSLEQTCSFPLSVPIGKSSKNATFRKPITRDCTGEIKIWDSRLLVPILQYNILKNLQNPLVRILGIHFWKKFVALSRNTKCRKCTLFKSELPEI